MLDYDEPIICGGGLSSEKKWISKKSFFISVKVLSKLFKGKFLHMMKELYDQKAYEFHGSSKQLQDKGAFELLLANLYQKPWVVYAKKPFAGPKQVFAYLGNYTHKVAISNSRILQMTNETVELSYTDYKDQTKKTQVLQGHEFTRRFLMHILPKRFQRIRSYGFLSNSCAKTSLVQIKSLLGVKESDLDVVKNLNTITLKDELLHHFGFDISLCPKCQSVNYSKVEKNKARSPPSMLI